MTDKNLIKRTKLKRKELGYPPRKKPTNYNKLIKLGETEPALDFAREELKKSYQNNINN